MIVVRDVFQLQFGRAREAVELAREVTEMDVRAGKPAARILTDVVGDYYTLVYESEHESLAAYEAHLGQDVASDEWKRWYARFAPLVREGRREIHRVVG